MLRQWLLPVVLVCATVLAAGCHRHAVRESHDLLDEATTLIAEHPDSIKAYEALLRDAVQQSESTQDWETCSRACLLLSQQVQWTREAEALALAEKALHTLDLMPEADSAISRELRTDTELALAGYLQQTGDHAHARTYLYNVLERAGAAMPDRRNAALAQLANLSLDEGKPDDALALALRMTLPADTTEEVECRFVLANCYLQCDSLDAARRIYSQIDTRRNTKARYVALRHLSEIAMLDHDYDNAPDLVDSAFASAEAVFFEALRQKDEYHRASMEQERATERLAYRQRLTQGLLIAVAVVAILIIVLVVTFGRQRRAIQRQRLQTEQRERELVEQKLRHEAALRRAEAEQRRIEAEQREREAREAEARLEQQETMIRLLQNFIIEKSEVIQRLHAEGDRKIQLSRRDWSEIEQTLDSITGGFVRRLRASHPTFREEDIQLCMLTRMNLPNQAIAAIYLITVSAVKHRKLKLKKDGFGEQNPERPLDDVITEI